MCSGVTKKKVNIAQNAVNSNIAQTAFSFMLLTRSVLDVLWSLDYYGYDGSLLTVHVMCESVFEIIFEGQTYLLFWSRKALCEVAQHLLVSNSVCINTRDRSPDEVKTFWYLCCLMLQILGRLISNISLYHIRNSTADLIKYYLLRRCLSWLLPISRRPNQIYKCPILSIISARHDWPWWRWGGHREARLGGCSYLTVWKSIAAIFHDRWKGSWSRYKTYGI